MSIQANFPALKPTLLLDFANVKALDPRITFTRASEGRYYDGKTFAKAEENLLLQSQDFTTTWTVAATTVSANTVSAPDGTTTADTVTATATTNIHVVAQTIVGSSLVRAISVFAKKNTHDFIQLCVASDGAPFANFNLASGVVGTAGASVTSSIQDVGNGWYRCSMVFTSTTATTGEIALVSSASAVRRESWTAAGTESVYLWGAQLEQRSSVTAYTATTTQPITNYIPQLMTAANGVARFDHNPTTEESLGLLIEEQRTNLLTYSAQFDNAAWEKIATSITANTIVAPDGTLTGDKLTENTANSEHFAQQALSFTSGAVYTASVYVKAAERTIVRFGAANTTTYAAASFFDVSTGTITSTSFGSATITFVGNGWYRLTVTGTAGATNSTNVRISLASTGTTTTYTGDGYSGIYIWGAQLEAGAFPTSYIPTVAAQVTRSADAASMTGANFSSWYRPDEGTLYAEFSAPNTEVNTRVAVGVNDGTTSEWILIGKGTNNRSSSEVYDGGAAQVTISSAAGNLVSTSGKVSFAYKVNDFAASTNGLLDGADTSGTLPTVSQMNIGDRATGSRQLNGHIRKIAFYPARVTNAQLQALTS